MAETRKPYILERVSTAILERAARLLPLDRYAVHLAVIDEELIRRAAQERSRGRQPVSDELFQNRSA